MSISKYFLIVIILILLILIGFSGWLAIRFYDFPIHFIGQRAYRDVLFQVSLGPRTPGSEAHDRIIIWLRSELEASGWQVEIQETIFMGHRIQNVIAKRSSLSPKIILGAHYDSRIKADQDIEINRLEAVPGANDGASGVSVILELARTLPQDIVPLWLVFFDAEDNSGIDEWIGLLGSTSFVSSLLEKPDAAVIVDMIGDADLNIYIECNSSMNLVNEIWSQATILGYTQFISETRYCISDDHTPFIEAGIPAIDIIDFDYPFWHTTSDTIDKISPESLQSVGDTLWYWVVVQK